MPANGPPAYYWRSQGGLEVDLIVQAGGRLWPIEIKLSATPSAGHTRNIERFKTLAAADAADTGLVVCRVDRPTVLPGGHLALPWRDFPQWAAERIGCGFRADAADH